MKSANPPVENETYNIFFELSLVIQRNVEQMSVSNGDFQL